MLNRRSFLALLGSTAIAPLLPAIASEGQYRPANLLTQGQAQHDLGDKLLAWWDMGFTGNFRDALIRIPLTGEQTREVTAWMSQGSTCCPLISAIGNEHHVVRAT